MPGLLQLTKFSEDMKNIGREIEVLQKRGSLSDFVPLPRNISSSDDSADFINGLPIEGTAGIAPGGDSADFINGLETRLSAEGTPDVPPLDILSAGPADVDTGGVDLGNLADGDDVGDLFKFASQDAGDIPPPGTADPVIFPEDLGDDLALEPQVPLPAPQSMLPDPALPGDASGALPDPALPGDMPDALPDPALPGDMPDPALPDPALLGDMPDALPGQIEEDKFVTAFTVPMDDQPLDEAMNMSIQGTNKIPSLTEKEYAAFTKNLNLYPLNLMLFIEDIIATNEYGDGISMAMIQAVISHYTARKLAAYLERLTGVSIKVPADFEARSYSVVQAYRHSFAYRLRNVIIPLTLFGLLAALVGFLLFISLRIYVYVPWTAEKLYKEGYVLLQDDKYPEAEQKFDAGLRRHAKKNWFYTYAKAFQEKHQYERAALLYRNILARYNHEKAAGLEYAEMELYDRNNYAQAEEIVRREVLDWHINDSDGMLLLGDITLEEGTANPESGKLESAREQYASLIHLYGANDVYLARMMRYFIRADNLREVLPMKNHFMSQKKMSLGSRDLTELSGYLMEKQFGPLPSQDEPLRVVIEDVRGLLELAIKAAPRNPETNYNFGKYFIYSNQPTPAAKTLEEAIRLYNGTFNPNRTQRLHHINAHRLLGEIYLEERQDLLAEQWLTKGIALFEHESAMNGLPSTEDVGRMYADLADIYYFMSYSPGEALYNYQAAVVNHHDTPSIHYRIGCLNYGDEDYQAAIRSFIKAVNGKPGDLHALFALATSLALRQDNFAAQGYYAELLDRLNLLRNQFGIQFPLFNAEHSNIVDFYMKGANNLGVILWRQAAQYGGSAKNADAIFWLSESLRAWDALNRNPDTLVRPAASNLAQENIRYITAPNAPFNPELYTQLSRILQGEAFR
ncbi:MAG: hypothetical protein LBS64_01015 [Spirochaetaceae bacterium]|jgi:TolA-binding protein|nr:hypothetical protein [Spirochaetaceae bacterium]